jgi:predicted transcriptional regulator
MMAKRPDGTLEHDIMTVLWSAEGPLQPGEIKERLATELAYTSVATVLGRLHAKGLVDRSTSGRAFAYAAIVDESELAARRIRAVLSSASDRTAVLAGFVGSLSKREAKALRTMLDENDR